MRPILVLPLILIILIMPVYATFASGDPILAPNPVPSSCTSNCNPILVEGPTLGPAITFSINTSITGRYKVLLGPSPFNVTITNDGSCVANQSDQTIIPKNTFGTISPLRAPQAYGYCLYYSSLPGAKTYSLEVAFKHPGDMNFIQTITWAIS